MSVGLGFRAERMARRIVTALIAALLFAISLGFFTMAAWEALADAGGRGLAALTIGAGYAALGLGALLFDRLARRRIKAKPTPSGLVLAEAFLVGLNAGRSAGTTHRRS